MILPEMIEEIAELGQKLSQENDVLIVCGIGGSYLGARALIEALQSSPASGNRGEPDSLKQHSPQVVFLGNHLSGREYDRIFRQYQDKRVVACVISKSGTTLETAISYRLVREFLLSKYTPDEIRERIITVTDEKNGALRAETTKQGYRSYVLPGNIGGRYSVLTPVGLIPCAFAGIDIHGLIQGARQAERDTQQAGGISSMHTAFLYAEKRVQMQLSGCVSELLITMEPSLYFIGEWWKQLMGESHGKEGTGLYPDTLSYTTDLHSLGQYVQEGKRLFFETMIWVEDASSSVSIPAMEGIQDGLDVLAGRSLHEMNKIALESTAKAHYDGGCPSMTWILPDITPETVGYFLYTMMYACALSGIMIGVNPFDQPGVEAYKSEMRKRL
jgi:glucose-6-phosphate isomerase